MPVSIDQHSPAVSPDAVFRCPNCGAGVLAGIVVCPACGVRLAAYESVLQQRRAAEEAAATTQSSELADIAESHTKEQLARQRVEWSRQVVALVVGTGILALLVFIGARLYEIRQQQVALRIEQQYLRAQTCLDAAVYDCARDGFADVLRQDGTHDLARSGLATARMALATQYAGAGQWESSLDELDALLAKDPANDQALALMRDVLSRWLGEAQARGQWFQAWRIRGIMRARFPDVTSVAPEMFRLGRYTQQEGYARA